MRLAPYTFSLTLSVLLLSACGGEPGTTATDSATGGSTSGASTSTSASTGEPITTGTSEPDPTTSGASESATGSTSIPGTSSTSTADPSSTGSTGPIDPSSTTADTSTGDAESSTTSDDTTGAIMDCLTLEQAFNAETLKIRSCKQPSECGVELPMTSCGCTRNWVARKDADTKPFYDLLAQGQELECELIGPSTCDCPAAEGFTCTQNICTWNYL